VGNVCVFCGGGGGTGVGREDFTVGVGIRIAEQQVVIRAQLLCESVGLGRIGSGGESILVLVVLHSKSGG